MSNVTTIITAKYELTSAAHTALALAGTPTTKTQTISLEVDAAQAIAAGVARVDDNGVIVQKITDSERLYLLSGTTKRGSSDYWARFDHIITADEALTAYQATLAALETAQRERDEKAKRERDENDTRLAGILPALLSGKLDYSIVVGNSSELLELLDGQDRGKLISFARCSDVNRAALRMRDEENLRLRKARSAAYKEEEEAKKQVAKARLAAERDAWISAHGSDRLKKASAAGMLDAMRGAYRDERIAHDLGADWLSWDTADESLENERINPSESELDDLLAERARWNNEQLEIQLRTVQCENDEDEDNYRPVLMMRLPWELDRWAVRYLDE